MHGFCGTVRGMPTRVPMPCGGLSLCTVDFGSTVGGCDVAEGAFDKGDIQQATQALTLACANVERMFATQGKGREFSVLLQVMDDAGYGALPSVELLCITV